MPPHLKNAENASRVLAQVRQLIESGGVAADGKLPTERELSIQLDVGRRALRRALDALEAEGLIWRRQGKGTFVGEPPDPTGRLAAEIGVNADALSVMEARLCIEPELAALCAIRAKPDDIARMRFLVERIDQSSDADAAELWDGSLHRLIARAAGNPILMAAFALVDEVRSSQLWQDERDRARSPRLREIYTQQHQLIVTTIADGNADAARAAMREHLTHLSRNLQAVRETDQT
ncbi:FadR/GntR family transcriptional regulator [Puniceibacterium sediminis]|uniref:Transcriptional regulator, GntR family n=1 Tax=Puniceibacterium sediminis TaxID=1608407 RepID=A0A238VSH8_9RHOB|nr:FadR/GntR family transcriptional regulator [Puniceibacterium sediminis]SNR37198.1 transcriptional regulator, GntR family [Puniceibacterium sediminis]